MSFEYCLVSLGWSLASLRWLLENQTTYILDLGKTSIRQSQLTEGTEAQKEQKLSSPVLLSVLVIF